MGRGYVPYRHDRGRNNQNRQSSGGGNRNNNEEPNKAFNVFIGVLFGMALLAGIKNTISSAISSITDKFSSKPETTVESTQSEYVIDKVGDKVWDEAKDTLKDDLINGIKERFGLDIQDDSNTIAVSYEDVNTPESYNNVVLQELRLRQRETTVMVVAENVLDDMESAYNNIINIAYNNTEDLDPLTTVEAKVARNYPDTGKMVVVLYYTE